MTAPTPIRSQVSIAGVPWPVYKLIALAVGIVVFVLVGVFTMTVGPAVVTASAAATVTWVALGLRRSSTE